jgi:hypothetical protein
MRVNRKLTVLVILTLTLLVAPALRAEYVVLRSGQRLTVTGYQLLGDKYRLQMSSGHRARRNIYSDYCAG